MTVEPIDWEHAMKDTQMAARAASRGTERMVKAMSEIKDEQLTLTRICRENQKETAAIREILKSLATTQKEQTAKVQHLLNHHFSTASHPEKRLPRGWGLTLIVCLVCGVFIGNLL